MTEPGDGDVLEKDVVFEVLASSRRRLLLYHLHRRGGKANLVDLAADVAAAETDGPVEEEVEKRHYISLYQTHVPKLEETGFVVYDEDEREVELTDKVIEISALVGKTSNRGHRWPFYYAVIATVGLVSMILPLTGVPIVEPPAVAGVLFGLLVVLSAVHVAATRDTDTEYSFLETLVDE
ncbi:hypothetical protein [Halalkaliarchaeum sp. AArc-CO]|uniref:DUF7344 domain-containing protein n=1 Tax=Halalkaliarchaeum sp. AArc-CO TaxID=2866381 RepID=UPI00217E6E87|nr:hypothetical protein [Halalkaliarchaeum sp. AArc-CO]